MQDNAEWRALLSELVSKRGRHGLDDRDRHEFGLAAPTLVGQVVDVAVRAIEITTARHLQKDGVDRLHGLHPVDSQRA